jgi:AraC family transcriptional regulator
MDRSDCKQQRVLHIKNMVCPRCIKVVREELEAIGLPVFEVELGRATVCASVDVAEEIIRAVLERNEFELLHDSKSELVEQVKLAVLDLIYQDKLPELNTTVSTFLASELMKDYAIISSTFKTIEEMPLSRYILLQKIERAKELLEYNEQSVSQIANRLGYKSVQHLSAQFKEITGVTPLRYRNAGGPARKPIHQI